MALKMFGIMQDNVKRFLCLPRGWKLFVALGDVGLVSRGKSAALIDKKLVRAWVRA